jgi:glycosyltransferase involved in cell wall biosynthesis
VPPGEAAALADGLGRLMDDRDRAARLARAAWDEAPRYSWDARAEKLRDAFARMR